MIYCLPSLLLPVIGEQKSGKTFYLSGKGIKAEGMEISKGFVVKFRSGSSKIESPSCGYNIRLLRSVLAENGVLKDAGNGYIFTQDYLFNSPSTAAGVVLGRSANGRTAWKTKNGKTLKEIQEAQAQE